MVSNGSSWTRRALEEADLPSLSISKNWIAIGIDGKSTGHSHVWSEITSKPSTFTPAAHGLVSLHIQCQGSQQAMLKALSANTYGFGNSLVRDHGKPIIYTISPQSSVVGDNR